MIWGSTGCTAGVDVTAEGVEDGVPAAPKASVAPDFVLMTPAPPVEPDVVLIKPAAPVELDAEAPLVALSPETLDAVPIVEPETAAPVGTVIEPEVLGVTPDLETDALIATEPKLVVV